MRWFSKYAFLATFVICLRTVTVHSFLPPPVVYKCGDDSDLLSPELLSIQSTCGGLSGMMTTSGGGNELASFFMVSGDLGVDNYCEVYSATTGELLTTFTGTGDNQGTLVAHAPLRYNCSLALAHGMLELTFQLVLFTDCGGDHTLSNLPQTILQPNYPGEYPHCVHCLWEFSGVPLTCSLAVRFTSGYLGHHDFIFLHNDTTTGIRLPNETSLSGLEYVLSGGSPSMEFVSDFVSTPTMKEFDLEVSLLSCSAPGLHCSETPTIVLEDMAKADLNVENGDTLYIASQRQTDLTTVMESCKMVVTDSTLPLLFHFNITECTPIVNANNDIISVTYMVWNAKDLPLQYEIQRYFFYCMNFTCDFNATSMVDSVALLPKAQKIEFTVAPVEGQFDVTFNLFPTDSLTSPLTSGSMVTVPDFVYAKIELSQVPVDATQFIMQMTNCWATDTSDPNSARKYYIISGSCPATNSFDPIEAINVTRNYMPLYGSFAFQIFAWTNVSEADQKIYVHCDVTICDNVISACDAPGCKRKRRQAIKTESDQNRKSNGGIFSVGPIRIASQQSEEVVQEQKVEDEEVVVIQRNDNPGHLAPNTILFIGCAFVMLFVVIAIYLKN